MRCRNYPESVVTGYVITAIQLQDTGEQHCY